MTFNDWQRDIDGYREYLTNVEDEALMGELDDLVQYIAGMDNLAWIQQDKKKAKLLNCMKKELYARMQRQNAKE